MSLRQSTALDHTLLIVDNIPAVDKNSEHYGKTYYGMPLPEAMRNLYNLIGVASQAFVFAHTYFSFRGSATSEAIFDDLVAEMMEQAFGSNPPSLFVELGWERSFTEGVRHATNSGLYGYEHARVNNQPVSPTLINVFSEFHWNDFYDLIGANSADDFVYEPHGITDDMVTRGVLRVLQSELGIIRSNRTDASWSGELSALLRHTTIRSRHYQRIALIKWKGVQPIVHMTATTDYSGPVPCECGDFGCEDHPDCLIAL
jgi:hypothetical protein